ncbi:hypothetical protein LSUE1_G008643 [Lachnellula suecica]|uniref:N-acetyltransferase domain-containing protein n=1 Tax=Lachnellula suecica TaxID=602035 RepID=A0A8T9BZF3_9HELO|nr:hypothetical protein LSUE1_G008643 [Lachnellula suecica]
MAEYILKEDPTRSEHDSIIDLAFKVWNDRSITTIIRITKGPILGDAPADLEAAISIDKERSWNRHINDPASHKPFVVHVPTGEIVGFIGWKIYTSTPFSKVPSRVQFRSWPEEDKEGRECAEEIVSQCFYPRQSWMNRPMATMDDTTVRQDHQKKGVGSSLVKWGLRKADELGIESFVEATDAGRKLYQKYGFSIIMKVLVDAENGTQERHEMIQKLTPQPIQYWAMWRPKGGVLMDGATQTLWEAIAIHD